MCKLDQERLAPMAIDIAAGACLLLVLTSLHVTLGGVTPLHDPLYGTYSLENVFPLPMITWLSIHNLQQLPRRSSFLLSYITGVIGSRGDITLRLQNPRAVTL